MIRVLFKVKLNGYRGSNPEQNGLMLPDDSALVETKEGQKKVVAEHSM
jgi:hypothetical protein